MYYPDEKANLERVDHEQPVKRSPNPAEGKPSTIRRILLILFFSLWLAVVVVIMYYIYSYVSSEEGLKSIRMSRSSQSKRDQLSDEQLEQELLRIKRSVLQSPTGFDAQGNSRLYCDAFGPCVHVCHDWFESYKSVDRSCLDKQPPQAKSLSDDGLCKKGINPRPLIMGNGGGDSKSACENTFEATEAGLKAGMSAVQLDISLSADGTPFLWRDHLPGSLMARIRQNGLMFVEKCKPMYLPRSFRPAHTLSWGQIRSSWFYTDFANSPQESSIPSLEDWVFNYGLNDQIEKIWLDVHCPDFLVDEILIRAWIIFNSKGIAHKLYYNIQPDATVQFPVALHFVGQVNLLTEVRSLSDQAFEQLSNLIVAPLKDREVQVITSEDYVFFNLLRKLINNEAGQHTPDSSDLSPNVFLDLVLDGNVVDRVRQLSNITSSCPNVIVWVVDQLSTIQELKCSTKNVEAIVTNFPERAKGVTCKSEEKNRVKDVITASPSEPAPKSVSCDNPCPRVLWPVCGSDDKIYPNECLLEKAACETQTNIRLKTGGDCEPPVFKLLEKQTQALKDKEQGAAGSCDSKKSACSSDNFNIDYLICGSDGKVYENKCVFLREQQCSTTSLKEIKNCAKNHCDLVCSDESKPVCGTDRITYRNLCALRKLTCRQTNSAVNLLHSGPCGTCDAKCPESGKSDPESGKPVCGSDGISYQNACALTKASCVQNRPIYVAKQGNCNTVVI